MEILNLHPQPQIYCTKLAQEQNKNLIQKKDVEIGSF
jgi:hypothetical protein